MGRLLLVLMLAACPAAAVADAASAPGEAVLAARTIRPGDTIAPADLRLGTAQAEGALTEPAAAVGLVARRLLVAGRPLVEGDVGPPALVRRNAHVVIVFERGSLSIRAEGRALSEGAVGERVRVMNLASRQTVTGTVAADGTVGVGVSE
jgi:flagella basal body P-ring formation protein FlgA